MGPGDSTTMNQTSMFDLFLSVQVSIGIILQGNQLNDTVDCIQETNKSLTVSYIFGRAVLVKGKRHRVF